VLQIKSGLREREGKAITNFQRALPPPDSDLAEQVLKDPYNFDFLTVTREAHEREIERGLLIHLRDLLLELGRGFAFVGSQVPLEVGDEIFYIDLLLYHVRLHCYFVIELKTGRFKPEWAGKLNFYLSAVDDLFRTGPARRPSGSCSARATAVRLWSTRCAALRSRLAYRAIALLGNSRS
jgi:predicted nuclease of restriction endonuclease-like (RecB) superfamily